MWRRNKQTKIEYFLNSPMIPTTDIRHVEWWADILPVRMVKLTPDWFKKLKSRYSTVNNNPNPPPTNLRVCPSFVNLMTNGYVLRNPAIISVTGAEEDGEFGVHIESPLDNHVEFHNEHIFGDGFPFLKDHMRFSMKVVNPFGMHTNKEVSVLFLPCWWDENHDNIKAIHGYVHWKPTRDLHLNINTYIRRPKVGESYHIPKGAPLVHLLFVDQVDIDFVRNDALRETDTAFAASYHSARHIMYGHIRNVAENIKDFLVGKS